MKNQYATPFYSAKQITQAVTNAAHLTIGGAELGVSIAAIIALAGVALPGLHIAAAAIAAIAIPLHALRVKAALADSAAPAR